MKGKLRKPSPAMIVACVALFVALGPAAYASHLVVTTSDIVDGEVRSPDLRDFGVTNVDLGANSVGTGKVIDGQITMPDLANGAVSNAKLGADSVETSKIVDGGIQTADLADGAVSNAKLAADSVETAKIIDGSIQTGDLADGAITSAKVLDGTIGAADLGPNSVGASELGDRIVVRAGTAVNVPGGAAHNGAYDVGTATAACLAGEELITGTGQWVPDDNASGNHELWIGEIRLNHSNENVIVDGGNDSGVDHSIQAVAHCLT